MSSLRRLQARYPSTLVNAVLRRASSSHSSYNKFAPHKNEQWIDFSTQLARTMGGRLNDYVTTTPFQLRENNNQGLGRILRPTKIKGEWEWDRQREGEWEADFMEIIRGCKACLAVCLQLCCWVRQLASTLTQNTYIPFELTDGGCKTKIYSISKQLGQADRVQNMTCQSVFGSLQHTKIFKWQDSLFTDCTAPFSLLRRLEEVNWKQVEPNADWEIRYPVRVMGNKSHCSTPLTFNSEPLRHRGFMPRLGTWLVERPLSNYSVSFQLHVFCFCFEPVW